MHKSIQEGKPAGRTSPGTPREPRGGAGGQLGSAFPSPEVGQWELVQARQPSRAFYSEWDALVSEYCLGREAGRGGLRVGQGLWHIPRRWPLDVALTVCESQACRGPNMCPTSSAWHTYCKETRSQWGLHFGAPRGRGSTHRHSNCAGRVLESTGPEHRDSGRLGGASSAHSCDGHRICDHGACSFVGVCLRASYPPTLCFWRLELL